MAILLPDRKQQSVGNGAHRFAQGRLQLKQVAPASFFEGPPDDGIVFALDIGHVSRPIFSMNDASGGYVHFDVDAAFISVSNLHAQPLIGSPAQTPNIRTAPGSQKLLKNTLPERSDGTRSAQVADKNCGVIAVLIEDLRGIGKAHAIRRKAGQQEISAG